MMQGDAYSVPVTITAQDGTVVTPDMVTCVEITIGNLSRKYPGAVTFDEDTGAWQFPLTQQQTFRLQQGKQETQARVVFASGDVFGGRGDTVFVTGSLSKGVLPQPEKETAGIVAPSISQVRLGNAGKIRATVGAAKVVLTSSLPPISETTKGQYLTNDGTEAKWADVDALPAMSAETKGKMLTNDGEKAEWGGAVRYDVEQSLTGTQATQARENIESFPRKILPYFFDPSESSEHDNDIMSAQFGDVINPGNIYTDDGGHTNEGMVFPAFVTRTENPALHTYLVYLLDASGQSWQIAKNIYDGTDGKTHYLFYDISNITLKCTMCVNFTQYSSSNWSADKNWDDAAALIESGGLVYAVHNNRVFSCIDHIPKNAPPPINGRIIFGSVTSGIFSPPSINRIDIKNISWYSNGIAYVDDYSKDLDDLPYVSYGAPQTLTAAMQAQARANIGLTPVAKTDEMTQSVGLDAETGELYTTPAAGDNTLGITSATVGQIAKITAVDADGKPTAWEAVTPETWNFVMADGTTVTKKVYVNADE